MRDTVQAWQCIGCGRIEAPAPCIGICSDRKVELVHASEFDSMSTQLALTRQQLARLEALLRRLAWTTPRHDAWERSYRILQEQARALLRDLEACSSE